ncbi:oligomeric golgi complex component, COG2-domain-containing protein [Russula brevipes]|nr:oligomeric golgi complex component, COG2-domain-containing protein [Russula brevipes]
MDLQSPTPIATSGTSRDPFELERLADELEAREHSFDAPDHDLPLYPPLAHGNPFFIATTFNVEDFLLSRVHTSLPDLRTELRDYLAVLKEELVQLINDDYEAFISLSTDLRGEGARLERLKFPLGDLRSQILESRQELSLVQDAIQTKLKKRSSLRDEKTYLHLLLKISESVARLESLLLIASPDGPSSPELKTLSLKSLGGPSEDNDDRPRGNRAKHLVRVATEYTQLLYHVSKAQADIRSAFVDEIQWRISRIQSTLSSDLDHLFSDTVTALGTGKLADTDKAKRMADLTECLRTYDALQLWRDAEDVLRRDVLRDFVKKVFPIYLAYHFPWRTPSPTSPTPPQTPFSIRERVPIPDTARTPHAPLTAFISRVNPFDAALAAAPRLDETDNPLAVLYNGILGFVERDLKRIMDVAERISARIGQGAEVVDAKGFEVLSNVIWAEIARSLMDELGSALFAAGRPDEFRKNYETTQSFIRSLQYLAPSARATRAMTEHPTFLAFERRWQLPVYFQLRWKEIVTKLEPESSLKKAEISPFAMSSSAAVWSAMKTCWDRNVYVPQLAHRFWKLTLQILSRYRTWIQSTLPPSPPDHGKALPLASEKLSTPGDTPKVVSRSSTPAPQTEGGSSESTSADDTLLRQCAAVIADVKLLESQVWALWHNEVNPMLGSMPVEEEAVSEHVRAEDALGVVLKSLTTLIPPLSSQIISVLTRRASDALQPVRSMPLQFRAMSNKRPPSEPSFFVAGVLRPVRAFFGVESGIGSGASLKEDLMQPYAEEVFEAVVQKYIFYVTAMRKKEESLRKLKKGKKPAFSLFGGAPKEDDGRDEERIRQQMVLDVEAFGKDAETLGVDAQGSAGFKTLHEMAIAPLNDAPDRFALRSAAFTCCRVDITIKLSLQWHWRIWMRFCPTGWRVRHGLGLALERFEFALLFWGKGMRGWVTEGWSRYEHERRTREETRIEMGTEGTRNDGDGKGHVGENDRKRASPCLAPGRREAASNVKMAHGSRTDVTGGAELADAACDAVSFDWPRWIRQVGVVS